MSEFSVLRFETSGPVAEVVLDRPDKLNAMAPVFFDEIRAAFEQVDADDAIRVAILRAEGRHFTAGLDLMAAADGVLKPDPANADSPVTANTNLYRLIRDWQGSISAAERCRKPVIAAVHGHCIGGGVDLTTACDVRLCTADATFSIQETKLAIVADIGTLQRITAIVGKGMAREMAFTGKRVDADRALRCGLVNDVYPDQESLLAAAREMAAEIAANSPLAVQGAKQVLQYSEQHTIDEGLEYVARWNSSFLHSRDLVEAMTAFLEKRQPEFVGR
ncbi:MAG: crotonase/enoyl-CoA hydratase family protein [bacterium]|nr:crotonase/enoyl-CoA hydratase family protein [bacterium]